MIPVTAEEVATFANSTQKEVLFAVKSVVSVPDNERTFSNTMKPWNCLANALLASLSTLYFTAENKLPSAVQAKEALNGLIGFLYGSIALNKDVHRAFLSYADKALSNPASIDSYQMYELNTVLATAQGLQPMLSKEQKATLERLVTLASKQPATPYLYKKGLAEEKEPDGPLTVLNLNTCFLPGKNPYFRGGAKPWEDRVHPLANTIIEHDPDIVCLQEVFAEDANEELYQALKNHYSHFYISIGTRPLGFALEQLGLPSGLLVASKYPVEAPRFAVFTVTGTAMNYGVFDFVVLGSEKTHIYTTHMKSLDEPESPETRALQLQEIIDKAEADFSVSNETTPAFVCGDFNIPWGRGEPGETLIRENFTDDYNKDRKVADADACTCTDYYTDYFFQTNGIPLRVNYNFQIIDYALLLKADKKHKLHTELIRMNHLSDPTEIITDHNALFTIISEN
ncbi:MAG: endonuclease/exonuclease/phosphatase family protein [Chlamydiales bacterium]|nr:endonuclease/exonuclease/phosphatase family protein [Chlamydiales bacterium]